MRSNRLYRLRNHNRFTPPSQGLIRNIERLNSCVMRCNYRKTPPLNQRVKFKITISSVGRSFDEGVINDRLKANYPIPEHSYVCAFLLIFQAKSGRGLTIDDFLKKEKKERRKKRVSYSFIVGIVSISSIYRLRSASFLLSNSSRRVYNRFVTHGAFLWQPDRHSNQGKKFFNR